MYILYIQCVDLYIKCLLLIYVMHCGKHFILDNARWFYLGNWASRPLMGYILLNKKICEGNFEYMLECIVLYTCRYNCTHKTEMILEIMKLHGLPAWNRICNLQYECRPLHLRLRLPVVIRYNYSRGCYLPWAWPLVLYFIGCNGGYM